MELEIRVMVWFCTLAAGFSGRFFDVLRMPRSASVRARKTEALQQLHRFPKSSRQLAGALMD